MHKIFAYLNLLHHSEHLIRLDTLSVLSIILSTSLCYKASNGLSSAEIPYWSIWSI